MFHFFFHNKILMKLIEMIKRKINNQKKYNIIAKLIHNCMKMFILIIKALIIYIRN